MHEKQVGYVPRGSGLSGSGRTFVSLLSRLASGLAFCCLVSTCIFLPWLRCSCVLLCRLLGLPWAFFGPLPGLSWDPFCASAGPFWAPWRPLGLLGPSWASPGSLLASPGAPWASSWAALGGSWPSLGPPLAVLSGLGWLSGGSWAVLHGLGWLLAGPGRVPG